MHSLARAGSSSGSSRALAASQKPSLGRKQSSVRLMGALAEVEQEIEQAQRALEKQQSLLAASSMLMASSACIVGSQQPSANLGDDEIVSVSDDEDEDETADIIDELRDEMSASDHAQLERLSNMCPPKIREDMRATSTFSGSERSSSRQEHAGSPGAASSLVGSAAHERASTRRRRTEVERASTRSRRSDKTSGRQSSNPSLLPAAPSSRLHAVCLELIETERKYERDLALIVHTFVQGLRRTAPDLIQPLTANAEQLLGLHTSLAERMVELARTMRGHRLADALGTELLAVSPYFVMYTTYCANFLQGSERLESAKRTNKELAKVRLSSRRPTPTLPPHPTPSLALSLFRDIHARGQLAGHLPHQLSARLHLPSRLPSRLPSADRTACRAHAPCQPSVPPPFHSSFSTLPWPTAEAADLGNIGRSSPRRRHRCCGGTSSSEASPRPSPSTPSSSSPCSASASTRSSSARSSRR